MKPKNFGLIFLIFLATIFCELSTAKRFDLADIPKKPDIFRSREEIIQYIIKLNEFFGVVGRPRYGKRGLDPMASEEEEENQIHIMSQRDLNIEKDQILNLDKNKQSLIEVLEGKRKSYGPSRIFGLNK